MAATEVYWVAKASLAKITSFASPEILYLALQVLMHTEGRWRVWFWSLAYLSVAGLAVVLWLNGLLGLRTWAM